MCGIAGLFSVTDQHSFLPAEVQAMLTPMHHRGPDGQGHFLDDGIALGHLRLSIIDIEGGAQPMKDMGASAVLVFNGEIYNAPTLRAELENSGVSFETSHSDTEVLLQAYLAWGEDCVSRFRGMFAFALWDANKRQLFIGRDRLGIKPLYYTQVGGVFAFASELKGLLPVAGLDKTINPEAIEDFMTLGYIPDPKTIYTQVHKLPPGHSLTIKRGDEKAQLTQYWDLNLVAAPCDDAEEALLKELAEAVQCRMIADVPLGAFLSGGVDSSAVVALMATQSPDPVITCAIGVDDPDYDESSYAQQVADLFGTDHSMRLADPAQWVDISKLAQVFDEPFADSSAIPTLKVSAAARERVTVALSGDGGDELFCGYRRQLLHLKEHKIRRLLPFGLRRVIFGVLGKIYPKFDYLPRIFRAKSTFQALAMDDASAYCHSVSKTPVAVLKKLRSSKLTTELQGYRTRHLFQSLYQSAPATTEMGRIKYIDFKTFLAGGVLTKVDRASMAHSLEVRVPILDHHFVEWASRLPDDCHQKGGQGKVIFKKALEKLLPKDILYRPKKGFSLPIGDWLKDDLSGYVTELSKARGLVKCGYFCMDTVEKLVREHLSGQKNHETTLWALIMLNESLIYLEQQ